jgi:transketolase
MRKEFVDELCRMAEADPRIVVLTGDLGFGVFDEYRDRFGDRFYNVGVAEQNMVGLATGLAAAGMRPYAYSIATFASMRPFEFMRNGPVLHGLPVTLVGVGGGLDYGHNGPTHFALEDIGTMRMQPGMTVLAPADPAQAETAAMLTQELDGPAYVRLGKTQTVLPRLGGQLRLGRAELIGDGEDLAIVSYGTLAATALEIADLLEDRGLRTTVAIAASLAPPPLQDLEALLERVPAAVAIENHYPVGGVGSLLCELVAERGLDTRVIRRGIERMPLGVAGDPDFLYERQGLDATTLARELETALDLTT